MLGSRSPFPPTARRGNAFMSLADQQDPIDFHHSTRSRQQLQPRILFATPEMADFVKTGGLGEVAGSLPRALRKHYDVRVLIPGYRQVVEQFDHIPVVAQLPGHAGVPPCDLGLVETSDGLQVYVVLNADLYQRDGTPYGNAQGDFGDNDIRFARLSLAAAEIARGIDGSWAADLLHLNDWQAALAPAYLAWNGLRVPSILTVHNLAYQGVFPRESWDASGYPKMPSRWMASSSTANSPFSRLGSTTRRT